MTSSYPTLQGFLEANGYAEICYNMEDKKLQQLGWGTTTNEGNYSQSTLIGNWNENSFDIKELSKRKPLPSQVDIFIIIITLCCICLLIFMLKYGHYFETTTGSSYKSKMPNTLQEKLRTTSELYMHSFHCTYNFLRHYLGGHRWGWGSVVSSTVDC